MFFVAFPGAVRGFVVAHEEEGFRLVAVLHEGDGLVGDDVGCVAGVDGGGGAGAGWGGVDKFGVPVGALAGEDGPVVEAGGEGGGGFAEMPFADHAGGVVSIGAEVLGDVGEAVVDCGIESEDVVGVVVGAGEDGGAGGGADGVGHVAVIEAHTSLGNSI